MGSDNLSPSVVAKPDYSAWIAENDPGSASSMEPGDKTVTGDGDRYGTLVLAYYY